MKEIKFYYCNRFILHFIWFGMTLAGFIIFIILFRNWLGTVGIEPNGRFISDWWFEHKAVFIFVIFVIPCIAYCVIFLLSMVIAVILQNNLYEIPNTKYLLFAKHFIFMSEYK